MRKNSSEDKRELLSQTSNNPYKDDFGGPLTTTTTTSDSGGYEMKGNSETEEMELGQGTSAESTDSIMAEIEKHRTVAQKIPLSAGNEHNDHNSYKLPSISTSGAVTTVLIDKTGVDMNELQRMIDEEEELARIILNPFNLGGYGMVCCLQWCVLLIAALQRLNRAIPHEHFDTRAAYTISTLSSLEIIMLLFTQASLSAKNNILTHSLFKLKSSTQYRQSGSSICCGYVTEVLWRTTVKFLWIINSICTLPLLFCVFLLQYCLGGRITGGRYDTSDEINQSIRNNISSDDNPNGHNRNEFRKKKRRFKVKKRKSHMVSGDKIRWDPYLVLKHMWIVTLDFALFPVRS